jgi:hypothetical protein
MIREIGKQMTTTLEQAIGIMETTADFYHQMIGNSGDDKGNRYWISAHMTALDLLERVKGLEENSLSLEHDAECDCYETFGN